MKIACPGVPDFYQGSELWSRNLVDPDNRRPVDFQSRTQALQTLFDNAHFDTSGVAKHLLAEWPVGRIKLYTIWKALGCRRQQPTMFREGEFIPLEAAGDQSHHILAFLRRHGEEHAVIIIPRWVTNIPKSVETTKLGTFWSGINLKLPVSSPNSWRNVFTAKTTEARPGDGNPCIEVSDMF